MIGAIVAFLFSIGLRTIGLIMAFGSGGVVTTLGFAVAFTIHTLD